MKPKFGRAFALAAALCMALSPCALALSEAHSFAYEIGEGATYYQVDGVNDSGAQKIHYIEYNPSSKVSPVVAYGSKLYGKSTITYVRDYLLKLGKKVIAGVNGDFFNMSTGLPIGLVVANGQLLSSADGQYAIGFQADGSAIIGQPVHSMVLAGSSGSVEINVFNKARGSMGRVLLDSNYSSETKITSGGLNLVLEKLDDKPVTPDCQIRLKVVSRATAYASMPIGENQMILSATEGYATDSMPYFAVGDELTLTVAATDSRWSQVQNAVGGKSLIHNGVVDTSGSMAGTQPRTAVGVKADGTVIFYEADGRQSGVSVGLTMDQLAQELKNLGCVDAINLDGGGSSAVVVQYPGDSQADVVNTPSEGSLRSCANYIMLLNNATKTGVASQLHIYPERNYALPGGQIALSAKATDSAYYPVSLPGEVAYGVASGGGSVSGSTYTAGDTPGDVVLEATSGGVSGSGKVVVLSRLSSLSLSRGGTTVSTLALTPGDTADLDVNATYLGNQVACQDASVTWSVSGDIGTIDQNGVFTADGKGVSGKITASYGNTSASVNVSLAGLQGVEDGDILADFEGENPFTAASANLKVTRQYNLVYSGQKALRIGYNFTNSPSVELAYNGDGSFGEAMTHFYSRVRGDGSGAQLYANFLDGDGETISVALGSGLSGSSYQMLSCNIPAGATEFVGFTLERGNADTGSIYIDQVIVGGSGSATASYPAISFTKAPQTVNTGSTAQIIGVVTDNGGRNALPEAFITVWVDGQKMSFSANQTNGNIAFTTPALSAGMHRVTVEAKDLFGNISRKSVTITAGSAAAGFVDVATSHWAAGHIAYVAGLGIVKGEPGNNNAMYFFPNRNLTRGEFAVIMARSLGLDTTADYSLDFADAAKIPSWAKGAVGAVAEAGIMGGTTDALGNVVFAPTTGITRQEVMAVIGRSLKRGYQQPGASFIDSSSIAPWATEHVDYLVGLGIVGGYQDGSIQPKGLITRAEIAKIMALLY